MNVVFVGSHPDDVELGCGGTLADHISKGDSVFVLVLTRGERGFHDFSFLKKSMKTLSVDKSQFLCLNIPDGCVKDDWETISSIENIILKKKTDRVYCHGFNETHQDHRNCHLATISACRRVKQVLFYEGPSTFNLNKNFFKKLKKKFVQAKLKSLSCYKGQYPKSFNLKSVKSLAVSNGYLMNRKYCFAEAFEIGRFIE